LIQPAGANAVRAALVLLDLLKRQPNGLAKLFLAHAEQGALLAEPCANVHVDGSRGSLQLLLGAALQGACRWLCANWCFADFL